MIRRASVTALLILLCVVAVPAQAPVRVEQFVYTVLSFNGKDYGGTFSREGSNSIYLLADVDNFLTARKTFVYFWPITQEWKMESSIFDQELDGLVEIWAVGGAPQELAKKRFTYFNVKGEYEYNWEVATGEKADEVRAYYESLQDAYFEARSKWSDASHEYQVEMDHLTNTTLTMRREGKDTTELVARLQAHEAKGPPPQPADQGVFLVAPREVRESYNINLPAGEYNIRFLNPDGTVMEGSEKKLILFEERRTDGAGYDIIPADKWTRPQESTNSRSVLYVNGKTDIFLRPFFEDEFNDLQYEKLIRNDGRGNASLYKWVKIQQVPKAVIELNGLETTSVTESPYAVEQVPGAALGYKIIPYEDDGTGGEPDLWAYLVNIDRDNPLIRVRAFEADGTELPGSERQIRVVYAARARGPLFVLVILPLALMGLVVAFRATKIG